ncbi:MAG: NAD(P)-dependent oxidoreductase [Deltaproteobacteria bacterium]|nr:NAD(P)-dependent oxidoreductase [Deltaproteobacteria bacterium]
MSNMLKIGLTGSIGVMGQVLKNNFQNYSWDCFSGDILNTDDVNDWLKNSHSWDGLIHLAAIVPIHVVKQDPIHALRVNVEGTCRLLEGLSKNLSKRPWFFLASTCHVYASSHELLKETSTTLPITAYGLTKLQAEQWTSVYERNQEFKICIGRIFSCSSRLHPKSYFIPSMIEKILNAPRGAALQIRGLDGVRDFQSADHACKVIEFLFQKRAAGIFNIASGMPVRLFDVVKRLQKKLDREDLMITPLDADVSSLASDLEKLRSLGFVPGVDLERLLDEAIVAYTTKD